jgi:hypothetical protein
MKRNLQLGDQKMFRLYTRKTTLLICITMVLACTPLGSQDNQKIEHPYRGVVLISRSLNPPDFARTVNLKILKIDLNTPGIRFKLTPPAGSLEVINQTTLDYLLQEKAQFAVNIHFYLPVGARETNLIGLAASDGNVYSGFETPVQTYAIVDYAPAINIDSGNNAAVVHPDLSYPDGKHIIEKMTLWNAVSGSAQIVTNGLKTIPVYKDPSHPDGLLTPDAKYSNNPPNRQHLGSWYDVLNPRTAIGLSPDNRTLILFTADGRGAGGSYGLTGSEMADILINDYGAYNVLNLDGGGSTTIAMKDPATGTPRIMNTPSDGPPRPVGSSLAIFAEMGRQLP